MLPRHRLESKIRDITTSSSLHVLKLKQAFQKLEELGDFYPTNKRYIVLHHSFTKDGTTVSWNPIRENHIKLFNTNDIGYHYGIEEIRKDEVYEVLYGRRINSKGCHCPQNDMNNVGVGFMFCGNFDIAPPPIEMLRKAADFIADLCNMAGISPNNIHGHREFNLAKSCPGKKFNMEQFRELVNERI